VHEPGLTSSAPAAETPDAVEPTQALGATVQSAYRLPVAAPQRALMPALLPVRRQHMTARPLQRGFMRQLLGMFVYRPAARVLRTFQVLTGRVDRA
jgi:hypothetical protein